METTRKRQFKMWLFKPREAKSSRAVQYNDANAFSSFGNPYSAACQNLEEAITVYLFCSYMLLSAAHHHWGQDVKAAGSPVWFNLPFLGTYGHEPHSCIKKKVKSGVEMDVTKPLFPSCLVFGPNIVREKYFIKSSYCFLNINQGHSHM